MVARMNSMCCGEPSGENPAGLITNVATVPRMPAHAGRTEVV
jgi:hypothetical protein